MSSSSSSSSSSAYVVVVGFGGVCLDLLAGLSSFPKPDDKTSCRTMTIQGGGGAGNTATCLSRLGLQVRLMSKLGNDFQGRTIVEELQADNIDTSFIVVAEGGRSPFSYVIVEKKTNTRTCILTKGDAPMVPKDVIPSQLESALAGARLTYFDGRYPHAGQIVAKESARKGIPILVDAEKRRDGLDEILDQSDYAVCKMKFLEAWTGEPSVPSAMISLLLRLPKLRFVIVTLGENGCIMLERCLKESPASEEDVDRVLESLKQQGDESIGSPFCISSPVMGMKAEGIGSMVGRLLLGTAEKIPPTELVDTTGAGDAFIGGIIYALCTDMPSERMLPFASKVAAEVCRSLGARTGLPRLTDPCLSSLLL